VGLPGFGPEFPTPEAGRIPGYPTDPYPGNIASVNISFSLAFMAKATRIKSLY